MMKKRKILAAALAAALAATSAVIPVLADELDEAAAAQDEAVVETAEEAAEIADDGIELAATATWEHGGEGTAANPYKISSADELKEFANTVNSDGVNNKSKYEGLYFELTQNIELNGYCCIGKYSATSNWNHPADFHFDGGDHTISGLQIDNTSGDRGLFGYVNDKFELKNLTVEGSVTGAYGVGGVIGRANGGKVSNVTFKGSVTINTNNYDSKTYNYNYAGGIVGVASGNMTIENCHNEATVTAADGASYARGLGGIVGYTSSYSTQINNCTNSGTITGKKSSLDIGGIAGYGGSSKIEGCKNSGDIVSEGAMVRLGGIAGESYSSIRTSSNTGDIKGNTGGYEYEDLEEGYESGYAIAGGIVGIGSGVYDSYNTGDVRMINGPGSVGGIVGWWNSGTIRNVYNTGDVYTGYGVEDLCEMGRAGGIIGYCKADDDEYTVSGAVNTGSISTAEGDEGGIVGNYPRNCDTVFENTYYEKDSCDIGFGGSYPSQPDVPGDVEAFDNLSELEATDKLGYDGSPWDFNSGTPQLTGNHRDITDAESIGVYFVEAWPPTETFHRKYDIVLRATDGGYIANLNTVDLTFDNSASADGVDYIITPAENIEIVQKDGNPDRYEFNYKDGVSRESGYDPIKIGELELVGYGAVDFKVNADATTNAVHTTTQNDSIVRDYLPGGAAAGGDGTLVVNKVFGEGTDAQDDDYQGTIGGGESTLEPDTREVQINFMFPNEVKTDKAADYTAMKVEVNGGVHEGASAPEPYSATIDLGSESYAEGITVDKNATFKYDSTPGAAPQVTVNPSDGANANGYKITLDVPVPEEMGSRYTFKFSGKGYRTYTVDAVIKGGSDTAHVINVWNNVMDGDLTVTASDGFADVTAPVTFLAGDIDDSKHIDLYDLSAAVAYFGKSNAPTGDVTTYDDSFAQYDLNRDGNIDSKDIAMVLVSWGM